ncbi:2-oxo acid dehydrogenase subunit E2 [Natronomonas halophila]|uniref:dihydrolipoamide acetyltransferase family protein n=1 Tax=Natronomonas halophila TaxID=2747817 RepID=UPI0015B44DDD|nr:dihydrolipoamide acetyltransferase family protein [Natronomonas halophila]QLD84226.1 2-oxo acid dehydrogenase subunit E2 [Natronomonas halophila]
MEVVTLPKLGISDEGELLAWEVEIGESVDEGDLLATFESDKASAEVTATASGVLLETYLDEGDVIPIEPGRPIAVIGDPDDQPPSYDEVADGEPSAASDGDEDAATEETTTDDDSSGGDTPSEDVKATPRAKKYAEEEGVTLGAVEGTGPQGAITEDDVIAYQEAQAGADGPTADDGAEADDESDDEAEPEGATEAESTEDDETGPTVTERRELSRTRRTIAERLSKSAREKPHVMGTREISIEQAEQLRERLNETGKHDVSLNDLILLAVARTLEDMPAFNAWYRDEAHELLSEVNVGYAVDTPNGLIVPVLEDLQAKDVVEIGTERRTKVERVRNDEHTPEDLSGGTFTVTNVGSLGIDVSYSIINPPQVAILAIGRRKPVAFERDGEVEFERAITFSLTIDHRVLDGADSGRFLERLDEYLRHPYQLLTELAGT